MSDMLVNLYNMPSRDYLERMRQENVIIKRPYIADKAEVLEFVRRAFPDSPGWVHECEYALHQDLITCYIAVHEKRVVGFACFDVSAKGFFGPTGVDEALRGKGIGGALLMKCLHSMREIGYGYAIIGWAAEDAIPFYRKLSGAVIIEDSPPEKSVFQRMVRF